MTKGDDVKISDAKDFLDAKNPIISKDITLSWVLQNLVTENSVYLFLSYLQSSSVWSMSLIIDMMNIFAVILILGGIVDCMAGKTCFCDVSWSAVRDKRTPVSDRLIYSLLSTPSAGLCSLIKIYGAHYGTYDTDVLSNQNTVYRNTTVYYGTSQYRKSRISYYDHILR